MVMACGEEKPRFAGLFCASSHPGFSAGEQAQLALCDFAHSAAAPACYARPNVAGKARFVCDTARLCADCPGRAAARHLPALSATGAGFQIATNRPLFRLLLNRKLRIDLRL